MAWYHRFRVAKKATKADLDRLETKMDEVNDALVAEIDETKKDFSDALAEMAGALSSVNDKLVVLQKAVDAGLPPSKRVLAALDDALAAGRAAKANADAQVAALTPAPTPVPVVDPPVAGSQPPAAVVSIDTGGVANTKGPDTAV